MACRSRSFLMLSALVVASLSTTDLPVALAQEQSVKPGINDSYQNPDVNEFLGRLEIESREVFQHREAIVAACQIKPGSTMADIGAGTGLFTRLCTTDTTRLDPDSIDVAYICDTYHHFEFPQKTLASLHQAMKSGGKLILIDFHRIEGQSTDWTLKHVRAGQEVFEAEIIKSGFKKVHENKDLLKDNYFVLFEKVSAPAAAE